MSEASGMNNRGEYSFSEENLGFLHTFNHIHMERTPLFANTARNVIFGMMFQFHIMAGGKRVSGLAQIEIFVYRAYLYLLWAGLVMVTIQAGSLHILVGKRTDERIVFFLIRSIAEAQCMLHFFQITYSYQAGCHRRAV